MGKYMKKSKITGDVAVMDVSQPTSLGVRTRAAKNLAIQRLGSTSPMTAPVCDAESSYLQLRNRRLEKPSVQHETRKSHRKKLNGSETVSDSDGKEKREDERCFDDSDYEVCCEAKDGRDLVPEASFGENSCEFGARDRTTRKKDSETIGMRGSTTRRMSFATSHAHGIAPTADEIEEFFAYAEQQQTSLFIDKYNFDVANERPLPGRYEWVQLFP